MPEIEVERLPVNHSPEPWALHAGGTPTTLFEVHSKEGEFAVIVATVLCEEDEPISIRDLANAALIVAAPKLLHALRKITNVPTCPIDELQAWAKASTVEARAVLADLKKAGVF